MYRQQFSHSISAIFIAAALAVSIESKAAPVFPPAHLDQHAQFAVATQTTAEARPSPWYFVAQLAPRETFGEALHHAPEVASTVTIAPWYRPAN